MVSPAGRSRRHRRQRADGASDPLSRHTSAGDSIPHAAQHSGRLPACRWASACSSGHESADGAGRRSKADVYRRNRVPHRHAITNHPIADKNIAARDSCRCPRPCNGPIRVWVWRPIPIGPIVSSGRSSACWTMPTRWTHLLVLVLFAHLTPLNQRHQDQETDRDQRCPNQRPRPVRRQSGTRRESIRGPPEGTPGTSTERRIDAQQPRFPPFPPLRFAMCLLVKGFVLPVPPSVAYHFRFLVQQPPKPSGNPG